jgi:2-polyprenyl-6-methoxyphenol hydroxylase-like FAD-dependent oxidoreductase
MAQTFDICIRGDGIVGRTLALLLARQNLQVALVTHPSKTTPDVRAYSLNSASRDALSSLRCWPDALHATPVMEMQVWGDEGGSVHFESPSPDGLAWIVDVPVLEAQLGDALRYQHNIALVGAPQVAQLTVICEGRNSLTRQELQVDTEVLPYQQTAVATRIRSGTPHGQKAMQWFAQKNNNNSSGLEILALLPLGGANGDAYGVVWSLPPVRAQEVMALNAEDFLATLQDASHGVAGSFELIGERASWPLQLAHVKQWTGTFPEGGAWVLAGDAAHSIHPLAGLGLNLGIADAVELAQVLEARLATAYWRSVGDRYFLRRYERARKAGILPAWAACDGLQRLFDHPNTSVQALRNWGMNSFDALAPLKQWTMQQAMR